MIKGATQHEDIAILNMYSIDNRDAKRIKQKVIKLKGKIREAEALYSPISATDRTGQKIS